MSEDISLQLQQFVIRDVPPGSTGCLQILAKVTPGEALQAAGNVPPALIGAKWADVYTWATILWRDGEAFLSFLKNESGKPTDLETLIDHQRRHPQVWDRLPFNQG